MKKILLLVFVHGFCGNDDTFGAFPPCIQDLIARSLPHHTVISKVFPKYETRGDLVCAVNKLRSWLSDIVMALEVSNKNKYPTTEPSVRTIFICHSMGGIVASEALLAIARESKAVEDPLGDTESVMWPFIQGVLAFDTPFLGLAPQMFAHTGAGGIKTVNEALEQVKSVASWWAGGSIAASATASATASQGTTTSTTSTSATRPDMLMIEEKKEKKDREKNREREKEKKSSSSSHNRRESKSEKSERRESKSEKSARRESKSEISEWRESKSGKSERKESKSESKSERRDSKADKYERRGSERSDRRESKSDRPKSDRKHSSSSSFSQKDATAATATAVASAPDFPLPKSPSTSPPTSPSNPSASTSIWSNWSKVALYAGAAATFAAAGAAAYTKRTEITSGFSWVTSHLEFIGVLMKGEQLRKRLRAVTSIPNVGFANLYTSMGPKSSRNLLNLAGANPKTQDFLAQERTFCSEPTKDSEFRKYFRKQINEKAKDEIEMHTGMFGAWTNPNYDNMCKEARDFVVKWVEDE